MRSVLLAAAVLGIMLLAVFTPAATADHNTENQIEKSCSHPATGTCLGTSGNDALYGTLLSDVINARPGEDDIDSGDGSDDLYGSSGRDDIFAGRGNDVAYGGNGADELYGEEGADELYAGCEYGCDQTGEDRDFLYGGDGDDILGAQNHKSDTLSCGTGSDIAFADPLGSGYGDSVGASCEIVMRN
jgi:Ca2+-binding RTX toxin-like protein